MLPDMIEVSFTAPTSEPSTPIAKAPLTAMLTASTPATRSVGPRRSLLPRASLSNDISDQERLKLLELENIGLGEELDHSESIRNQLIAELEDLRYRLTSIPQSDGLSNPNVPACSGPDSTPRSSTAIETTPNSEAANLSTSSSTSTLNESMFASSSARPQAELKAAKRLVQRFTTLISSYNPNAPFSCVSDGFNKFDDGLLDGEGGGDDSRYFNLDQSLVVDPDRSAIAPCNLFLNTPNGKNKLKRGFGQDLLDDIESLRSAWEDFGRRVAFSRAEDRVALESVTKKARESSDRADRLEQELSHLRTAASATKDDSSAERKEQESSSKSRQIAALEAKLSQTEQLLDQHKAESELTLEAVQRKSSATIEGLQMQISQQTHQNTEVSELVSQLKERKERLFQIQLKQQQSRSLAKMVDRQQSLVQLLSSNHSDAADLKQSFETYSTDLTSSFASVRAKEERSPEAPEAKETTAVATTQTSAVQRVESITQTIEVQSENVVASVVTLEEEKIRLNAKIDEQQQRILRREAQIGMHQQTIRGLENDLSRTRVNQRLAEDTVEDLEAEKETLEQQVVTLTGQITELTNSKQAVDAKLEELQQKLSSTTVPAGLIESEHGQQQEEIVALKNEINSLKDANQSLMQGHAKLENLKTALETQVAELEGKIASLESSILNKEKMEVENEQLNVLRMQLRRSEDKVALLGRELDSLQLSLAEQRESASLDSDRLAELQDLVLELQNERTAILADRDAIHADLKASLELKELQGSKLELFEGQVNQLTQHLASMQSELTSKQSELEALQSVHEKALTEASEVKERLSCLETALKERDEAMHKRNEEYWSLKEDFAELEEAAEAEKSRLLVTSTAQQQMESELEDARERIKTQESLLLKLKSEIVQCRSTEEFLNEQYKAAQNRVKVLEVRISDLETIATSAESTPAIETQESQVQPNDSDSPSSSSSSSQVQARLDEMNAKLQTSEAELQDLRIKVVELEDQLTNKAQEIEDADTKILSALKEAKKFATRYNKVLAKYEGLVQQQQQQQEQAQQQEKEKEIQMQMVVDQQPVVPHPSTNVDAESARSSAPQVLAGRKRAKPDSRDDEEEERGSSTSGNNASASSSLTKDGVTPSRSDVRPIYAPSPHSESRGSAAIRNVPAKASTFTPVKRGVRSVSTTTATASAKRGLGGTTTTGTDSRANEHVFKAVPQDVGGGSEYSSETPSKAVDATKVPAGVVAGGMTRSTSNPSELIAARLTNNVHNTHADVRDSTSTIVSTVIASSPVKKHLLKDKTNLGIATTAKPLSGSHGSSTTTATTKHASDPPIKPSKARLGESVNSNGNGGLQRAKPNLSAGRERERHQGTGAGAGAGVAAADFLARIKAQRSTNTVSATTTTASSRH